MTRRRRRTLLLRAAAAVAYAAAIGLASAPAWLPPGTTAPPGVERSADAPVRATVGALARPAALPARLPVEPAGRAPVTSSTGETAGSGSSASRSSGSSASAAPSPPAGGDEPSKRIVDFEG